MTTFSRKISSASYRRGVKKHDLEITGSASHVTRSDASTSDKNFLHKGVAVLELPEALSLELRSMSIALSGIQKDIRALRGDVESLRAAEASPKHRSEHGGVARLGSLPQRDGSRHKPGLRRRQRAQTSEEDDQKSESGGVLAEESSMQPAESRMQPVDSAAAMQPAESTMQPMESGMQPMTSGMQPVHSGMYPMASGMRPFESRMKRVSSASSTCSSRPSQSQLFTVAVSDHAAMQRQVCVREGLVTGRLDIAAICDEDGKVNVNFNDLQIRVDSDLVKRGQGKWMIEPASRLRLTFDVCSLIVLLYDLCMTPFVFAFEVTLTGALALISFLAVCYWFLDMMVSFRTGYYSDGALEMNGWKVARHYLRTNFCIDCSVLVAEGFAMMSRNMSEQSVGADLLRLTKVGRILRLLAVLRVSHLADIFNRLNLRYATVGFTLHVSGILLVMCYVTHALACLWYYIGSQASSDTGARWTEMAGHVHGHTYDELSMLYQYLTSFHFVLTQVASGSMEVTPVNTVERALTCLLVLFGLLTIGSLVSSLSTLMVDVRSKAERQVHQKTLMRRYLRSLGVRKQLAFNLEHYVTRRLDYQRPLTHHDVDALNLLSAQLRTDLHAEVYGPYMRVLPILRLCCHLDRGLMHKLARDVIDSRFYDDSAIIFPSGKEADSAFMVMEGGAEYTMEAGTFELSGDWVEPMEEGICYAEAALWSNWVHRGTASPSIGGCIIVTINVDSFAAAMQQRRLVRDLVFEYAVSFCRCLQEHITIVTDCDITHTSYDDVILGVTDSVRVFLGMAACALLEEKFRKHAGWANGVFDRDARSSLERLVEEVKDSRSCLVVTPAGDVQRLVALACVRIERALDKRIFVHLGKITEENDAEADGSQERKWRVVPWCALPGKKMKDGDQVAGALSKLISDGELQMFGTSLRLEIESKDVEWQWSRRYGIFTKYIRHVQHCEIALEHSTEDLPLTVVVPSADDFVANSLKSGMKSEGVGALSSTFLVHAVRDVVLSLGNPRGPYVSGWMTSQDFEALRKPACEPFLQKWLDSLPIQKVLFDTAAEWGVASITGNASYV